MWIDSHCHLASPDFDADREEVLERARAAGVELLVAIGSGYGSDETAAAARLAASEPRVFATAGLHPHDAAQMDDAFRARLRALLDEEKVVAVGECGLDYHYMHAPAEVQREVLAEQLALARELRMPVSIHVRGDGPEAYEDLLAIWKREGRGALRGVLHCYTYDLAFARRALDAGLDVSFSGILTFRRDRGLRDVARALPLDRLLVETDAPFLAPEPHRGRRNEPARVVRVGEVLAEVKGRPVAEVAEATARNARSLFGLPDPGTLP